MKIVSRPTAIAVSAVAVIGMAAPAFATAKPAPTSLNLRSAHATVKAKSNDKFTATLSSKGQALAGQTVYLQERTAPTSGHKTTWNDVSNTLTNASGQATFTVTPPLASHKNTQQDQYRAVFKGSPTDAASHSAIVTVTVKRA